MPRPPESFTTARLVGRLPRVEDAPAVFAAYARDPVVTRYLTWAPHRDIESLAVFQQTQIERWKSNGGPFAWMLCRDGTDTPIGSIGVTFDGYKAMFGYVLARPHWGQGLMTEALAHLVGWTLDQPEIHRAWAFCDVENPGSARVMEKAGMQREGVLRRWHVCPTLGPEPRDCVAYARVR